MERYVNKVNLPTYGEFYVTGVEENSFEFLQQIQEALKKLYEYEEREEKGTLLFLPCKVDDPVYKICRSGTSTIYTIEHDGHKYSREVFQHYIAEVPFSIDMLSEVGKTVFLSREQAYEELARLED